MADTTLLRQGSDQLANLLGLITPETSGHATPCSDWTVGELADHIVWSTSGMLTMAQGGQMDWSRAPEHHDDPAMAFRGLADDLMASAAAAGDAFPSGMALGELAVHTYDLSTALGRDTAVLDPDVAESGHAFMKASLTEERRGDSFGPALPAPDGADAYARIAAFAGRHV